MPDNTITTPPSPYDSKSTAVDQNQQPSETKSGMGYISQEMIPNGTIKQQHLTATPKIAKGDLYYGDGNNNFVRVPVGSVGQLLGVLSAAPSWTSSVLATALKSLTTAVDVSAATAPINGQVLTATGGTAATWQTSSTPTPYTLSSKVGSFTRNMSTDTSNYSVTGVGFQPVLGIFLAVGGNDVDNMSTGFSDSAKNQTCLRWQAGTWAQGSGYVTSNRPGGVGNIYSLAINSWDADGFTVAPDKFNSPTGTVTVLYLVLK